MLSEWCIYSLNWEISEFLIKKMVRDTSEATTGNYSKVSVTTNSHGFAYPREHKYFVPFTGSPQLSEAILKLSAAPTAIVKDLKHSEAV